MRTQEEAMELFNENENLIYSTIHRRFNSAKFRELHGVDSDDIVQYGKMGLYKACQTYDESKGTYFSTHAINHIYWMISNETKRDSLGSDGKWTSDLADRTSLDRVVSEDSSGNEQCLHTYIESREYGYDELKASQLLEIIADNISKKFATICKLRSEGYTYKEIGHMFGTSHQSIRQQITYNRKKVTELLKAV